MTPPPSRLTAVCLAALVIATTLVTTAAATAPRSKQPVRRGIGVFRLADTFHPGTAYNRYDFLVVGAGDVAAAGKARRVLMYKAGSEVQQSPSGDRGAANTGVPYAEAAANGWLLRDAAGNVLQPAKDDWLGDVGSKGFQQAWLTNVSGHLRRHHIDGVFIDNVVCTLSNLTGGHMPAKYPTAAAWADAQEAFIEFVGPRLKAMGLYVAINAYCEGPDNGSANNAWWARLAPSVSAETSEFFEQNPNNPAQPFFDAAATSWLGNWQGKLNVIRVAQHHGADAFAITWGTRDNTALMTYARASYLLVWNGRGGGFVYSTLDGSDPWNAAWTTAIGKPLRSMQRAGSVYFRRYSKGYVVVNPSLSTVTAALPAGLETPSGAPAGRTMQLAPTTAAIFRR